jgi:hypothetical protein
MEEAQALMELVSRFLDQHGITYTLRGDQRVVDTFHTSRSCHYHAAISMREAPTTLLRVEVLIPEIVPEDRRVEMAEAITRANCGLPLGCFELDLAEGELAFRTSIPVADGVLTQDQFFHLLVAALLTADAYHRAFNRLLYADDLSPAEVIAEVEMAG